MGFNLGECNTQRKCFEKDKINFENENEQLKREKKKISEEITKILKSLNVITFILHKYKCVQ